MTTLRGLLDGMYFASTSERDKGSRFERFLKTYLKTEPKYADLFSDVWLWQEWPDRQGRPDTGIDLVAKDRYTGELVAIQAKFFDPAHRLEKGAIDSFFTELGKEPFAQGMIVSTTDRWSTHAEAALNGQSKPVQRLRLQDLENSTIDWAVFDPNKPEVMVRSSAKEPRKYQSDAIHDVVEGFKLHDRGKLIMACGTGKTFTTLKLVEEMVPLGGSVLFLVPSIALLQQTLNEWTANAALPLRSFAVCSDSKVGRREDEDLSAHDLGYPATTNPSRLVERFKSGDTHNGISVIYSTYQSIDVIRQAQRLGLPNFDLIICDEAHRTTGISQPGSDDSAFVRVHDEEFLASQKRLYMTATPRIYVEDSKVKAEKDGVKVYSMDEQADYGPEFHHLGFGRAVEMGHLADYKVLILAVDEESVASSFQDLLAREGDMNLDDVARIVGCWNGLSKKGVNGERLSITDSRPMQRAVAFARSIKDSQLIANQLNVIGRELVMNAEEGRHELVMKAKHVDGTFNVLERSSRIDWLEAGADPFECRILTNAKCLTEGVDVPSLDAVLFLNPRNSQVDVVQAVGRVMRKAPGKEYGYIILPIAVPASQNPETALNDNKKYKVVWDVLQALRAHDDRFEAMINKLDLDKRSNNLIDVIGVGAPSGNEKDNSKSGTVAGATLFTLANATEWQNAIFARMVKKVGDRRYWEDWASDVRDIANRQAARVTGIIESSPEAASEFNEFHAAIRANLNDGIAADDAVNMLVQHIITKPVFDALFKDARFSESNPVSIVMDRMIARLERFNLDSETESLEEFYRSVRIRAEGISDPVGRQRIVTELYERFFRLAFPDTAKSLGIVYTPVEIVDFMIRTVDEVLSENFGVNVSAEGVHLLDPFTGTGTYIVRLMQLGLIDPNDLLRKYLSELHANEILLMAYYIAAINIEAAFHTLAEEHAVSLETNNRDEKYLPFKGIVLTDTFQMTEDVDALDHRVFITNNDRVIEQNSLDIRVVIGNPPWVMTDSGKRNYPSLDRSIRDTYAKESGRGLKVSLYDSYIRAIRWSSNRIQEGKGGVVCLVTNSGYLEGNTAVGLRKSLAKEFHEIYIYSLRGNSLAGGPSARNEGGNVFGVRVGVAIIVLVRRPEPVKNARLHVRITADGMTAKEKLEELAGASIADNKWDTREAPGDGSWMSEVREDYRQFDSLGQKSAKESQSIFHEYSSGYQTHRDAWLTSFSRSKLESRVRRMIEVYNDAALARRVEDETLGNSEIKWTKKLAENARAGRIAKFNPDAIAITQYRPFQKAWVYLDKNFVWSTYRLSRFFGGDYAQENKAILVPGPGHAYFSALMVENVFDYGTLDKAAAFPLFAFDLGETSEDALFSSELGAVGGRNSNLSAETLNRYRERFGPKVTSEELFHYAYAILHSEEYRREFTADLKREMPRIPMVRDVKSFWKFVDAGSQLADLHLNYEKVRPFDLELVKSDRAPKDDAALYRVTKLRYGGKPGAWDKSRLIVNEFLEFVGIPEEAHSYRIGSRSALDWIIDRYQIKVDGDTGLQNDPNDWASEHNEPRYIADLVCRIVTLSLETQKIASDLPALKWE